MADEDDLQMYCKSLPKVELHAHLNGSISNDTMCKLLRRKRNKLVDIPEAWQTTIAKGQKRNLEECFQMFKIIHTLVDEEEAVTLVANDVVKEFASDGVVYLELRTTPRANQDTGMTKTSYVDAVIRGIKTALSTLSSMIYVRLLFSIDRRQSVAEAMDTVLLAEKYSKLQLSDDDVKVVGVDLSGDPRVGDMSSLLTVLKLVKEKELKLAMHLSEIPSRNEETLLLIRGACPDRIGHGTFMHPEVGGTSEIVQEVIDKKISIEVCLTSNLKTQTVSSYDKHHFRFWRQKNHPCILCTDDKGVFSTSLSEEYYLAACSFGLTKRELCDLSSEAIDHIFEGEAIKNKLRNFWQVDIECSKPDYNTTLS